jgi:hypothetical protein
LLHVLIRGCQAKRPPCRPVASWLPGVAARFANLDQTANDRDFSLHPGAERCFTAQAFGDRLDSRTFERRIDFAFADEPGADAAYHAKQGNPYRRRNIGKKDHWIGLYSFTLRMTAIVGRRIK